MKSQIFELAVRQVKEGMMAEFTSARSLFIEKWKVQPGAQADREFQSLMTMPVPLNDVFVGMTAWDSVESYENASKLFWGGPELTAFMGTVNLPAFGLITQIEGTPFDLRTLANEPGQILEIAIRKPKGVPFKEFDSARKAFIAKLSSHAGVIDNYEFEVIGGPEEERRVGMTIYRSKAEWEVARQGAGSSPEGKAFFSVIDPTIIVYAISI